MGTDIFYHSISELYLVRIKGALSSCFVIIKSSTVNIFCYNQKKHTHYILLESKALGLGIFKTFSMNTHICTMIFKLKRYPRYESSLFNSSKRAICYKESNLI